MIITCPECSTRYQADGAKFPAAGRKVKCAKCGHAWHQDPPAPEPVVELDDEPVPAQPAPRESAPQEPEPETQPEPEPAPQAAPESDPPVEDVPRVAAFTPEPVFDAPAPVRRRAVVDEDAVRRPSLWPGRLGVLVGWGLLAAIIVIGGWAAVHYRQSVATAWPQTASLYKLFGMPVNARGIEFDDVSYRREQQDGQSVLAITGQLKNISGREQPVSQIRAALSNDDGRELYHWTFSAGITTMKPGQVAKFLTRISSPPPGARHLEVRFAKDGE